MIKSNKPSSVSVALNKAKISIDRNVAVEKKAPSGFTIKLANTQVEREAAYRLAYRVYREKGYVKENANEWLVGNCDFNSETAMLIVQDKEKIVLGTVTMIFDRSVSVPAYLIYPSEINTLRKNKEKIVEISRLAIDPNHRNAKEILLLLFNYLYIFSYYVKNYTCLAIEVNPRHKDYYRSLLCFEVIGDEKSCPNVEGAPAVLLKSPLQRLAFEVRKCTNEVHDKRNRTIFPHCIRADLEGFVAAYLEKQYKPISEEEKLYFGFMESGINLAVCV